MVQKACNSKPAARGGPGKTTKKKPTKERAARKGEADDEPGAAAAAAAAADKKQQQALLDVFGDAFGPVLGDEAAFAAVLQRVKQALYERDFDGAFGHAEHLDVYAARWSPTRALCYARVLAGIRPHLAGLVTAAATAVRAEAEGAPPPPPPPPPPQQQRLRMLAIGGGAAEIVALAAFLHQPTTTTGEGEKGEEGGGGGGGGGEPEAGSAQAPWAGDLTLLDVGPWAGVVDKLYGRLTTPPPLSAYASAAARAANRALVEPARFRASFTQRDVLELGPARLGELVGAPPAPLLVTLLFTLNELYTADGIGKTTGFLRGLARAVAAGSLLLVVDSPGSYSETAVGKDAQKYPMHWLLDQTLLTAAQLPEGACHWEKLESDESVWFRVAEGLRYPIPLENMRYQMHLYRAISPVTVDD